MTIVTSKYIEKTTLSRRTPKLCDLSGLACEDVVNEAPIVGSVYVLMNSETMLLTVILV